MFEQRNAATETFLGAPLMVPSPRREAEPGWGATVGRRSVPVSPEVAALQAAAAAVAAVDPAQLDPAQALADAEAILAIGETLRIATMTRVADVEDRRLHRIEDAPSTNSWLREHGSPMTTADAVLARRLPQFPLVAEAVRAHSVGVTGAIRITKALVKLRRWLDRPHGFIDGQPAEQVLQAVICDGARDLVLEGLGGLADDDPRLPALTDALAEIQARPVSQLARLEAAFVLLAEHLEPDLLPGALGTLIDAMLPNELERRARKGHDDRGLALQPEFDEKGWIITDGHLDLELGELFHAVLKAAMAVDADNPADSEAYRAAREAGWTSADGADGLGSEAGDCAGPRSRRQRQHDALKLALRLLLDSGVLGTRDKVAPHIHVTVGLDRLQEQPGSAPAVGDSGARLPLSLVRGWWSNSSVSRFVLSLGRKVIETSHTERTLKAHERRAKRIETGGRCQAAACRSGPDTPLIPHHPNAWARTGTTSKDDSVLFCPLDHHHVHTGVTMRLRDGRRLNEKGWIQK